MKLLLDSHTLLWLQTADPRLSADANAALTDRSNELFLSAASVWEIAIKSGLKKLTLSEPFGVLLPRVMTTYNVLLVPITVDDCTAYEQLSFPDPKHRGSVRPDDRGAHHSRRYDVGQRRFEVRCLRRHQALVKEPPPTAVKSRSRSTFGDSPVPPPRLRLSWRAETFGQPCGTVRDGPQPSPASNRSAVTSLRRRIGPGGGRRWRG